MDILETEKEFTPKWKGPGEKEIVLAIRRLTPAEKNACWIADGNGGITADLSRFVRKSAKLKNKFTWYGKDITTGDDICDTVGLDILFAETAREVINYNTVPIPKN